MKDNVENFLLNYALSDVIILESEGNIDREGNGFSLPVRKCIEGLGFKTFVISLVRDHELLHLLGTKPIIITGGMTEATSDLEWVCRSREFLKKMMLPEDGSISRTPVLGICFGAQLIAESYRQGSVSFLKESEIGPRSVYIDIPEHPLFRNIPDILQVYEFHYNKIRVEGFIPISTTTLSGETFLQAFQVPGTLCHGLQFHPEFDNHCIEGLIEHYRGFLSKLGHVHLSFMEDKPVLQPLSEIFKNFMDLADKVPERVPCVTDKAKDSCIRSVRMHENLSDTVHTKIDNI